MAKSSRVSMRHLDDGADAATFLAEHDRIEVVELDLASEAFDLLPHLSLSRWILRRLRDPSGSQPVAMKQDRPFSACASVRKMSLIGTEKNHLWPVSR